MPPKMALDKKTATQAGGYIPAFSFLIKNYSSADWVCPAVAYIFGYAEGRTATAPA